MIPLGRDIGYLPGTKDEKMQLWMQPIFDNLSYLMGLHNGGRQDEAAEPDGPSVSTANRRLPEQMPVVRLPRRGWPAAS